MSRRTLLIDGDIDAYQIACACASETIDWGDGVSTASSGLDDAQRQIVGRINYYLRILEADQAIVCLTDKHNFRKDILPSYKANRKSVKKPELLAPLHGFLRENFEVFSRPHLEADDVMGILATIGDCKILEGDRVIVSIDKDLKGIPGQLYNPKKEVMSVTSIEEADYWHLLQTLTGDAVDGYSGCPGLGKVRAQKLLTSSEIEPWPTVVGAFEKAGLTEADALVQARVARILRAEDYDFTKKKPILWNPPCPIKTL